MLDVASFVIIIAVMGFAFSLFSLGICFYVAVEMAAFKKATHTVQYVPYAGVPLDEDGFEEITDEMKEKFKNEMI